jgi:hypothetical protein
MTTPLAQQTGGLSHPHLAGYAQTFSMGNVFPIDFSLKDDVLNPVENSVWECGSLLPLFFFWGAIPALLAKTTKNAFFKINHLRNANL